MTRSKVLQRLAETDERIDEYEYDKGNDCGEHWLHLKWPYICDGMASIHEYTVRECLSMAKSIEDGTGWKGV